MLSFFLSSNNDLFPQCILDLTYVHSQALHIILFCSLLLPCYTFLSKQSHDDLCGWEELPQHNPRSHLLFSVKILLRKPKCLNKSWQHERRPTALISTFSPQLWCAQFFSLPWKLFGSILAILLWVCVTGSWEDWTLWLAPLCYMNKMLILWIVSCFRTTAWQVQPCRTERGLAVEVQNSLWLPHQGGWDDRHPAS